MYTALGAYTTKIAFKDTKTDKQSKNIEEVEHTLAKPG